MKSILAVVFCFAVFMSTVGCATQEDLQRLEKRIAVLEEKQQAKENVDQSRQKNLENCVTVDAAEAYFGYHCCPGKLA